MSTKYFWGKGFTRSYFPVQNDLPIQLPTQTPAIYLFSTEPTRAAAAAGTGAVQSIGAWKVAAFPPYEVQYTFTDVADPDPTGSDTEGTYYEAINFILEAGGQTQTVVRTLTLCRSTGGYDDPGTKTVDLAAIYPAIVDYYTLEQMNDHITIAQEEFRIDLAARGWEWSSLGELRNAKYLIAYKALANLCFSQVKEEGDRFFIKYNEFNVKYETLKNALPLKADKDNDGEHETTVVTTGNSYISAR